MRIKYNKTQIPLYIGVCFLLCIVSIELLAILKLNNGFLVYTLDDPYIHLSLAENIKKGHYGINLSEFSAPSSSILWPFIIAPFSAFEYSLLLINTISTIISVILFAKILNLSLDFDNGNIRNLLFSIITILFIITTNIVSIIFTGMEHSLQVLFVLLIFYGLTNVIQKNEITWWFLFAIITAPLIRYECLSISFASILFLIIRKHFKSSFFSMLLLSFLISSFTFFLINIDLEPLPSSIIAKSSLTQNGATLKSIFKNIARSMLNRQGAILYFGTLVLFLYAMTGKNANKRQLSLVAICSLLAHFVAGKYGWYNRYEIYIWVFLSATITYIFATPIKEILEKYKKSYAYAAVIAIFAGILIAAAPYIYNLFTLPRAANNIYQQQYQMHRFAVEYYKLPIAVNDLGYASYKNNNYVLDLWGLGSEKALKIRLSAKKNTIWMKNLTNEYNIGLAMIYENWFKENIPKEWIKIGELKLGAKRITPANEKVVFYATENKFTPIIEKQLRLFKKTLPQNVKFTFAKKQ